MEAIKNYLEKMFANMPNTDSVKRAKDELLQMMEDKYNELIAEGKNENEAVGTVITEFGNLDELAEALGVTEEVKDERVRTKENPQRTLSLQEITEYLKDKKKVTLMKAFGIFLLISSCTWGDLLGAVGFFGSVTAGILLLVYKSNVWKKWLQVRKGKAQLDMQAAEYVLAEKKRMYPMWMLLRTLGIISIVLFWAPGSILRSLGCTTNFGGSALFFFVGLGVALLVFSGDIRKNYHTLLLLNDINTMSGEYVKNERVVYKNEYLGAFMDIYWPVCTCLYFIWSFLTFDWLISWILWPIASVANYIIQINFSERQ